MKFNSEKLIRPSAKQDQMIVGLLVILILLIFIGWKFNLSMIQDSKQIRNDIREQEQIIQMEHKNLEFLERLSSQQKKLSADIKRVQSALPHQDEKAEEMIAMLEDIALQDGMIIEGIGIRVIPESQLNHDGLVGVVNVVEYSFSVESYLPNVLNFINAIRASYRLMDITAMEIEKRQDGIYRAGFIVHAYHLATPQYD